jgi:hypothetical protein
MEIVSTHCSYAIYVEMLTVIIILIVMIDTLILWLMVIFSLLMFLYFCDSNDRVAMAFCDIRILAALRRQQYIHTQTKRPEIFVLARNMKSTAYRRAVATIVLEQQQEDVHFL